MKVKFVKKPLTLQEQTVVNMSRKQKRFLTVAGNLRRKAAELLVEAERNEANAKGYGQVAEVLAGKRHKPVA